MQNLIENFLNGNLTDARNKAKRFSAAKIRLWLVENYGWSFQKSQLAAEYLKTGQGFQSYCDAI